MAVLMGFLLLDVTEGQKTNMTFIKKTQSETVILKFLKLNQVAV
jgi:hypothetical protein